MQAKTCEDVFVPSDLKISSQSYKFISWEATYCNAGHTNSVQKQTYPWLVALRPLSHSILPCGFRASSEHL